MQDMVGGDYFRTPVKFQGSDIFVFVGGVKEKAGLYLIPCLPLHRKQAVVNKSINRRIYSRFLA